MAGRVGFQGFMGNTLRNRVFHFGHSEYFEKDNKAYDDFMQQYWVPLLTGDAAAAHYDKRSTLGLLGGLFLWALNNSGPIKLSFYACLFLAPLIYVSSMFLDAELQSKVARARLLAFRAQTLVNSAPDIALKLSVAAVRQLEPEEELPLWRKVILTPRTIVPQHTVIDTLIRNLQVMPDELIQVIRGEDLESFFTVAIGQIQSQV